MDNPAFKIVFGIVLIAADAYFVWSGRLPVDGGPVAAGVDLSGVFQMIAAVILIFGVASIALGLLKLRR